MLHNQTPKRLSSVINHKPPGPGDLYEGLQNTPLFFPNGEPSGFVLGAARHLPVPGDRDCDIDTDGDIDRNDIALILAARNTPATGPGDPRDADGDGVISVLDARTCVLKCTNPRCAP